MWNRCIDGFGNHDPGKGRYQQQKSPWDCIHQGREWADKLKPNATPAADLLEKIREIVTENNLQSVNEFINECLRFSIENLKIKSDNEGK